MPSVTVETSFCFHPPQIMKKCTCIREPGKQVVQLCTYYLQNGSGIQAEGKMVLVQDGTSTTLPVGMHVCAASYKAHREYIYIES